MVSLKEADPHLAQWLEEVTRRMRDLQDWVIKADIAIFASNWIRCQQVAHDAYMKREDAVRYCLLSGFDVAAAEGPIRGSGGVESTPESSPLDVRTASVPGTTVEPKGKVDLSPPVASTVQAGNPLDLTRGRILRLEQAMDRMGLKRSTFYERRNPNSRFFDASFPKPLELGEGSVGYLEAEIDQWIATRPTAGSRKVRKLRKSKARSSS